MNTSLVAHTISLSLKPVFFFFFWPEKKSVLKKSVKFEEKYFISQYVKPISVQQTVLVSYCLLIKTDADSTGAGYQTGAI